MRPLALIPIGMMLAVAVAAGAIYYDRLASAKDSPNVQTAPESEHALDDAPAGAPAAPRVDAPAARRAGEPQRDDQQDTPTFFSVPIE